MGIGDWGLGIGDWGLGIGPISPNIIPNKKGKNTILNIAGFISRYLGIPYVFTIS